MLIITIILTMLITTSECYPNLTQYSQNDYIVLSERLDLVGYNHNYLGNVYMRQFKYNRTNFAINISTTWIVDVNRPVLVYVQSYKFASNEYRLFPITFPFDLCDVFARNIFGLGNLHEYGNLFQCPIKKGRYYFYNWYPDYTKLPPYAPRGRYQINMDLRISKISVLKFNWYITVQDVPLPY